jgi:hypothetical protein
LLPVGTAGGWSQNIPTGLMLIRAGHPKDPVKVHVAARRKLKNQTMVLPLFLHKTAACPRRGETMSHTVMYNSELHIVESKLQGDMTVGEAEKFVTEIAKIAKEKDCHSIFIDFRKVSQKLSMVEMYRLPDRTKNIFAAFGMNILLYKRANVVQKDLDDYVFHENVMVNRGHNEKVFTDIEQAKKWLIGK